MNFEIQDNKIIVLCNQFNPESILQCGQVFSYKKINDYYFVYPKNNLAVVYKKENKFVIEVLNGKIEFFINYFDLKTNYEEIIEKIKLKINDNLILKAVSFGKGIRILNQDCVETLISFIFSQNNNIKRFTNSLDKLRQEKGHEIACCCSEVEEINEILKNQKFFSFPEIEVLKTLDEKYFCHLGAGYRAQYLALAVKELDEFFKLKNVETNCLLEKLLSFKGVGLKVAQCVMLFGFHKTDVFPVDTWISKAYLDLTQSKNKIPPTKISKILSKKFGNLSGYIQQYLFYFKRENK